MTFKFRFAMVAVAFALLLSSPAIFAAERAFTPAQVQTSIRLAISDDVQPSILTPSFAELATGPSRFTGSIKAAKCNPRVRIDLRLNPTPCMFGASQGPVWVLWGDSNAGAWIPALDQAARMHSARLAVFIFNGCKSRFIDGTEVGFIDKLNACRDWHAALPAAVSQLHPSVIISTELASGFSGKKSAVPAFADQWKTAFDAISVSAPSATRVLLEPTPNNVAGGGQSRSIPACLSVVENKSILSCSPKMSKNLWASGNYWTYLMAYKESAARAGAMLIPTSQLFCSSVPGPVQHCPAVVAGFNVFVDQDHVSTAYMTYIGSAFNKLLISKGI